MKAAEFVVKGQPNVTVEITADPEGDSTKVMITERRRIHIDVDDLGKRSAVLKDNDGRVIAVLVG